MHTYWRCMHVGILASHTMGITFTRASTWSPVRCRQLRLRCVTPGRLGSNCPRASPVTPLHWLTPRDRKLVMLLSACTQATCYRLPEECHSCLAVCNHGMLPKACHVHIIVVLNRTMAALLMFNGVWTVLSTLSYVTRDCDNAMAGILSTCATPVGMAVSTVGLCCLQQCVVHRMA